MIKTTKELLKFWEEQMKQSHRSSNYFFRKSPSHYHMMLIVMAAYKEMRNISVEELKTQLFKTSRPESSAIHIIFVFFEKNLALIREFFKNDLPFSLGLFNLKSLVEEILVDLGNKPLISLSFPTLLVPTNISLIFLFNI